jgi:hypothetical protein
MIYSPEERMSRRDYGVRYWEAAEVANHIVVIETHAALSHTSSIGFHVGTDDFCRKGRRDCVSEGADITHWSG